MSKAEEFTLAMASISGGDLLQVSVQLQDSERCQIPRILVEVHPIRLEPGQPDSLLGTAVAWPAIEQLEAAGGTRAKNSGALERSGSCGAVELWSSESQ